MSQDMQGDLTTNYFISLLDYHQITSYLRKETEIIYKGDCYQFSYVKEQFSAKKIADIYVRPKVLYIPADRSFCTSIRNPTRVAGLPRKTLEFLADFVDAELALGDKNYDLPVNGFSFRYDENSKESFIRDDHKNYEIETFSASSGLQSVTPLTLTTAYYSYLLEKSPQNIISLDQIRAVKSKLDPALIINSRLINIVEEPEQNLFPESQADVLYYLLRCKNATQPQSAYKNSLLITTHSPYIIEALNNSIYAQRLRSLGKDIHNLLRDEELVAYDAVAAYKFADGKIESIKNDALQQIDAEYLDSCSERIRDTYSKLEDIEFEAT
ncbi:MAG: hypothetical protein IJS09_05350 [Treponema sp.]|nr:hypothetical protein [Treponema sp.]